MKVSNCIRSFRLERGLTQRELADLVGVSKNAISDYERGSYLPNLIVAYRLMEVFECSLNRLFMFWEEVPIS